MKKKLRSYVKYNNKNFENFENIYKQFVQAS